MAVETAKTVLYEKLTGENKHIAVITLNRGERLNTINGQLAEELFDAIEDVEKDDNIRVYIITGAPRPDGRPAFCAGADLREGPRDRAWILKVNEVMNRMEDMMKPSIAAIDGPCTGGGIELAESCDLRVAAETAEISDLHLWNTGSGLGGAGASTRLPRIIGLTRAKYIILTSKILNGHEAEKFGFVVEVYPKGKLMEGTLTLARKVAQQIPHGVHITLAHMKWGQYMDTYQQMRFASQFSRMMPPDEEARSATRERFSKGIKPPR